MQITELQSEEELVVLKASSDLTGPVKAITFFL